MSPLELLQVRRTGDRQGNRREFIVQFHPKTMGNLGVRMGERVVLSAWHQDQEYRVFAMALRYPHSEGLAEFQIAVDQKLRVAIGVRPGDWVGLHRVNGRKRMLNQLIERMIRTQPQLMRVYKTTFEDMEIDIARIPATTFEIIGAKPGSTVSVSSTCAHQRLRAVKLVRRPRDGRESTRSSRPYVDLELHRLSGPTEAVSHVEDLPPIFLDNDARHALGIHDAQPVRVVRDALDVLFDRVYFISLPIVVGLVAGVLGVTDIGMRLRIALCLLLSAVTFGIVLLEVRSRFPNR